MNKKYVTKDERKVIKGVLAGKIDPNKASIERILARPHVAVTFEAILDEQGLNEVSLARKIGDIVNRKSNRSVNSSTGAVTTNQTAVDSNTLSAIKMIWTAQGKFIERSEVHHSGSIQKMEDEQLDNIIEQSNSFLNNRVRKYDVGETK